MARVVLLVCVVALLIVLPPYAHSAAGRHATVELISRESAVGAGSVLTLGIHFKLEAGWHIYWINPGDSGQPPSLQWQLPAGFSAGEIQWPTPDKLQSSPTLADYGYHDDVLLMVPMHVPAEISNGSPLEFSVQAKWLICREVCIPDHAKLKLTLPVGEAVRDPGSAVLFDHAYQRIPQSWPKQWTASAESRKDDFLLTIVTGKPVHKVEFFPLYQAQIDNAAAQTVKSTPRGCTVLMKKSDLLLKPITALQGLLILDGQAFQVRAAIRAKVALK